MTNFIDRFLDESEPWENRDYSAPQSIRHNEAARQKPEDLAGGVLPLSKRLPDELVQKLHLLAVAEGLTFPAYVDRVASDFRHGHGEPVER